MTKTFKINQSGIVKFLLCFVFITFVFYPFLQMVLHIEKGDLSRILNSPNFGTAVKNSLIISFSSTLISVGLGMMLALCIQRTNIKFKNILYLILILPMLVPSISHGMGLIVLFGTNGIVKNLFGLETTIYGYAGSIVGSVLYSYPVAFIMLNDVLRYEDSSPYEAAEVLGIPKFRRAFCISLPYLKRPLMSAFFSVFTMVITDYGVPMMIGGKSTTLAVMMFQEVLGQLNFGKGIVIGLVLLIPAVITFVFNVLSKNNSKISFVTKSIIPGKNWKRDGFAYVLCTIVILAIVAILGSFVVLAFTQKYPSNLTLTLDNFTKMFALRGNVYLMNSILIAVMVSVVGVIVSFITAYLTTRMPSKFSQMLHLFSITSLAIPGIVLGLSYSLTFSGTAIYGTLAILVLANLMHFFASPYLLVYNCLSKINEHLEDVGTTLGISRTNIIFGVILPQCKATILEVVSYFFVNSMMTISAVSFLANISTKPLSLMIGQFEGQMLYECAAVVSLVILLMNVIVKGIVYIVNNRITK